MAVDVHRRRHARYTCATGAAIWAAVDVHRRRHARYTCATGAAIWAAVDVHKATRIFTLVSRNASAAGPALLVLHTPADALARALGHVATRSRAPSLGAPRDAPRCAGSAAKRADGRNRRGVAWRGDAGRAPPLELARALAPEPQSA